MAINHLWLTAKRPSTKNPALNHRLIFPTARRHETIVSIAIQPVFAYKTGNISGGSVNQTQPARKFFDQILKRR